MYRSSVNSQQLIVFLFNLFYVQSNITSINTSNIWPQVLKNIQIQIRKVSIFCSANMRRNFRHYFTNRPQDLGPSQLQILISLSWQCAGAPACAPHKIQQLVRRKYQELRIVFFCNKESEYFTVGKFRVEFIIHIKWHISISECFGSFVLQSQHCFTFSG